MDDLIGVVKLFAGTFAPRTYMYCRGQLISVNQNPALFAVLGTTYGGNGQTTFGLPDLRGRVAIGSAQGPGLSNYILGQVSGTENVSITQSNMPAHTHALQVSNQEGNVAVPVAGKSLAAMVDTSVNQILSYNDKAPTVALNANTNSVVGNNVPISIMQPYLALDYIICVEGVFPSRN